MPVKNKESLKNAEEKYFSLFELASDAIIVMDLKGNMVDVNPSICKLLDYSKDELLKMNVAELISPDQLKTDPVSLDPVLKGGHIIRERKLKRKDGSIVELEINVKKISKDRILANGRDITNLREAQKKIALSESTLRGAFENSAIGMALTSLDGKWLKVNNVLCEIVGYTQQEMLSLNFQQITHPDDLEKDLEFVRQALKGERAINRIEKRYFHKNGSVVWIKLNISLVKDTIGKPLYFVAQIEDITEKKRVAEQLEEREKQLRLFVEHSPASLAMFDKDMRYIIVSRRWLSDYNLGQQEITGKSHYEIFPNLPQRWKEIHQRCLAGAVEKNEEDSFKREDGSTEWLKWEIHPWSKASGEIGGIIMLTEVITERKTLEIKLEQSEEKHRALVENISDAIVLMDENAELIYLSPSSERILGYNAGDVQGRKVFEFVYPDDLQFVFEIFQKSKSSPGIPIADQFRMSHKDGKFIWIEGSIINFLHNPGVNGFIVNYRDITERKKAEAELKKINHTIGERMKELNCLYRLSEIANKPENSMTDIIEQFIEIIPRSYQYPAVTCARIIFNNEIFKTKFFSESNWKQEADIIANDKNIGKVEVFYTEQMPDEQEDPFLKEERFLLDTIADILGNSSEQRKAEIELKESEEKFRILVEQSLAGVYILQDNKFRYVNPELEKAIGYSKEELLNNMSIEELVHEDDLENVRRNYFLRLDGRDTANQYSFRAIRKNGTTIYVEVIASSIIYGGEPAIIGTLIDITSRIEDEKRINQAVIEAQENERLQIGMELHDNVKQILAASGIFLGIAKDSLDDKKKAYEILDNISSYNTEAIDELRRLSHQLAPSVDASIALVDKINWLLRSLKVAEKMKVLVHIDEFEHPINNKIELTFYRILQEQLSNVLKYANASQAEIIIRSVNQHVLLQIRDNGRGFDSTEKKEGIGLINIRRRVQLLNGKVEILSSRGNGCQITVQVPV